MRACGGIQRACVGPECVRAGPSHAPGSSEHGHVRAVTQRIRRRRRSACEWERGSRHEGEVDARRREGWRGGERGREHEDLERERERESNKDEVVISGIYLPYKPSAGACVE